MRRLSLFCFLAVLAVPLAEAKAADPRKPAAFEPVARTLQQAVADGKIIGAQLAIGSRDGPVLERAFGKLAPASARAVDGETLFCIGSCSKPFAATCLLILCDKGTLTLDAPVDRWLPAFRRLEVAGGAAAERAPKLRELLAHRGGIYSQKEKLTRDQRAAIRDFTLTLERSADLIARQPLLWQPGTKYAYSGAGYCIAGRAAEVAGKMPFEDVLRKSLCRPLGLARTTYFPAREDKNVAVGGRKQGGTVQVDRQAPHLADPHRLPLIGGSLYSTAHETAAFARLVLNEGRHGKKRSFSADAWREMTRRQYPDQNYGLGWGMELDGSGPATALSHGGALASYRSTLHLDLKGGHYLVAHWTLADASAPEKEGLGGSLTRAWRAALR
jgi:CubicO group peptidase (beta-lactamase class C family)